MPKLPAFPPEPGVRLPSVRPMVCYEIVEAIGKGGKGIAYKVIERGGDYDGAFRVVKLPSLDVTKYSVEDIRRRIDEGHVAIDAEMQALADLRETDGVAPILEVVGQGWHFDKDGRKEQIKVFHTVYDFIAGDDLDKWCEKQFPNENGEFRGIADISIWSTLARQLFGILDRVHYQRVVHGDVWPPNIRIRPDGKPVIMDFGQAWSLESVFEKQSDSYTAHEFLAPERYASSGRRTRWYATADIYSMGGVLFYLATGQPPPSPWTDKEGQAIKANRQLKQEVAQAIRNRNQPLFKANLGVVDVIMACMSPNLDYRARHAGVVLETIDAFCEPVNLNVDGATAIELEFRQVLNELIDLRKQSIAVNPVFQKIVLRRIHSLRDDISPLRSRVFSIAGDREAHVNVVLDCLSTLNRDDELFAVTSTKFWKKGNFGPYGRLSAMLTRVALRGARIKWAVLVDNQLLIEDRDVLAYQQRAVQDYLDCSGSASIVYGPDSNFFVCYRVLPESDIEKVRRERDTGILLHTGQYWTLIAPDYSEASGTISAVRLWSSPLRRENLLRAYDEHAKAAIPITKNVLT
jgi:serine/threonine protein kinase